MPAVLSDPRASPDGPIGSRIITLRRPGITVPPSAKAGIRRRWPLAPAQTSEPSCYEKMVRVKVFIRQSISYTDFEKVTGNMEQPNAPTCGGSSLIDFVSGPKLLYFWYSHFSETMGTPGMSESRPGHARSERGTLLAKCCRGQAAG